MTIHHFFLVAGCVLWLYILFSFCLKLAADTHRRNRRRKRMQQIALFFSDDYPEQFRTRDFRKILKYAQDDLLFSYICDCYTDLPEICSSSERSILVLYMKKVLHSRIASLKPNDKIGRCLLINNIYQCSISSDEIKLFLLECGEKTQLEQFCIDLQKEAWKVKIAR